MGQQRSRLDLILVRQGRFPSREQAREAIVSGSVFVNGLLTKKPGRLVSSDDVVEVRGEPLPYVSRGGVKLSHALKFFGIGLTGLVVLDVGAATGGFTDCALQAGARRVIAVDVGYGQLAWKLRNDPRVTVLERTNIRYLTPATLYEKADFATVDVSFISLERVLPPVGRLLNEEAAGLALIKPQFEAGPGNVGRKGVVREAATHIAVCTRIVAFITAMGWEVRGLTHSPVRGPEGNIEFFVYFSKESGKPWRGDIKETVALSWKQFGLE